MEQYNAKFAEVYDIFMDNTDYDAWAKYIISLLPTDFPKGARIFECGCGTGALTLRLNKAGYDVTGSDISRDMLEVAAEKSRRCGQKTKFICMDMRRIELHRPVDCIIAACDCVNYLTSREDVEKFLLTAFNGLRPGGILLFDVSSRYKLQHILGQNGYCDSRTDVAYFWQTAMMRKQACGNGAGVFCEVGKRRARRTALFPIFRKAYSTCSFRKGACFVA